MDVALLEVGEQAVQLALGRVFAEREGVAEGGNGLGARGEHELVVGKVRAARAADDLLLRVNLRDAVADEPGAVVAGDLDEPVLVRVASVEGLGYLHRPVRERRLGGNEREVDTVAGEVAQGHQGFERSDAAASDQDLGGGRLSHVSTVNLARHGAIGPNCGNPGGELRMAELAPVDAVSLGARDVPERVQGSQQGPHLE